MTPTVSATPVPATLSFGRLVVLVRDYDAALTFYQAAFGARVLFDAPSPAGDRYLHLALGADVDPPAAESATRSAAGFWLVRATGEDVAHVGRQTGGQPLAVLYTTDVRAATARVESAGGAVVQPLRWADGAGFAHVADLYGNEFVIVEFVTSAP